MTGEGLGGPAEELVAEITSRVARVETGMSRAAIEDIVASFASTRSRIRRLAGALAARPQVLADGRSPAPRPVGDLLIALKAAGADAVSAPVCAGPGCGKQLVTLQRPGQDRYCSSCYHAGMKAPCAGCGRTLPVATRSPAGEPLCWRCVPRDTRDPAEVIVSVVLAVDPALDRGVVAAAAAQAAWQPRQRDRLARALEQRPDLLTGAGAAAPERSVLRLIDLLAAAGATRVVRPACSGCGVVKPLRNKRDGMFACWACNSADAAVACSRCGRVRRPAVRDATGAPVCAGCRIRDLDNLERCSGCGRRAPVIARTADGWPRCRYCKPALTAACFLCGRTRECEISQATGKPWCDPCTQLWSRCAGCRTFAAVYGGTRAQPLCARCLNPDPGFWRRCPVCARTWQLGKEPCQRCRLDQAITQTLSGPTGVIRDGLQALRQALLATERPGTIQDWMARPANRALLSELARDSCPLTHQTRDQFPPSRPLAHLRAVLVAAGGLPPRDERMASLQRWLTTVITQRGDPREREILHQYARWYLLRRLRSRLAPASQPGKHGQATRHATDRETANIRNRVLAAIRVLDLAADKQLTLASITQADLDAWTADAKFTYRDCTGTFIRWAVAGKHARPGLRPHHADRASQQRPHDTEKRWQDARRLLHDDSLPLPDRVAGLLVLLYAQNPAGIEGLTTAAVDDDGTSVRLTLATVPIVLPDPLAGLMREHLATRRGHATTGQPAVVPWLFPGGRPGHPLDAGTISERLKAIGLHPRADRAAALFTLAAELPAAILARTLGISIGTAVSWQKTASGDWLTYAAAISRRPPDSGSAADRCPSRQL